MTTFRKFWDRLQPNPWSKPRRWRYWAMIAGLGKPHVTFTPTGKATATNPRLTHENHPGPARRPRRWSQR